MRNNEIKKKDEIIQELISKNEEDKRESQSKDSSKDSSIIRYGRKEANKVVPSSEGFSSFKIQIPSNPSDPSVPSEPIPNSESSKRFSIRSEIQHKLDYKL